MRLLNKKQYSIINKNLKEIEDVLKDSQVITDSPLEFKSMDSMELHLNKAQVIPNLYYIYKSFDIAVTIQFNEKQDKYYIHTYNCLSSISDNYSKFKLLDDKKGLHDIPIKDGFYNLDIAKRWFNNVVRDIINQYNPMEIY